MQITDADREAAADILDEVSNLLDHNGIGQVADLVRDGEYDDHPVVERVAARVKAERDRIVAWLREDAAKTKADLERLQKQSGLTNTQIWEWQRLIDWKVSLATAIEKGQP